MGQKNLTHRYSCIIPFFNEGTRILDTLALVSNVSFFSSVICVDDGSTDLMSSQIAQQFPNVQLITLSKNGGKSGAIMAGLSAVTTDMVFLLDADLLGLDATELSHAMQTFETHHLDMLILGREQSPWIVKWSRGDILLTGQRILAKKDLDTICSTSPTQYQLEIAINTYMRHQKKHVAWMASSIRNTYKYKKWGFARGIGRDISMVVDMIRYAGIREYLMQIRTFAKTHVK